MKVFRLILRCLGMALYVAGAAVLLLRFSQGLDTGRRSMGDEWANLLGLAFPFLLGAGLRRLGRD